MENYVTISFFAFMLVFGCKKDEVNTSPVITFVSIEPDSAIQFSDQVNITLSFVDQ